MDEATLSRMDRLWNTISRMEASIAVIQHRLEDLDDDFKRLERKVEDSRCNGTCNGNGRKQRAKQYAAVGGGGVGLVVIVDQIMRYVTGA